MAENILAQRHMHQSELVVFAAHNGHVSRQHPFAGSVLAAEPAIDYVSVGIAFGAGRFNAGAGDPDGGFDPRLTTIDAESAPAGSLEHLIGLADLDALVIDLRPLRGTDHPLAAPMTYREVGLAGGLPQFEFEWPPTDTYDVLVWFNAVTPGNVLRVDGDFW